MSSDDYAARMAETHARFTQAMTDMLSAYGTTQTVFTHLLRDVKTHLHELRESNDELKQLILEQGSELRALRERLNDGQP